MRPNIDQFVAIERFSLAVPIGRDGMRDEYTTEFWLCHASLNRDEAVHDLMAHSVE